MGRRGRQPGPRDCHGSHPPCTWQASQGRWGKHARSRAHPHKLPARCSGTPCAQERRGTAGTTRDKGLNPTAHTLEQFRLNSGRKIWEQHWRAREQGLSENTPISQLCLMATEGEKRGQKVEIGRKRVGKQKGESEGCQRNPCKHSSAVHSPTPPYLRVPKATDVWIKVKEDSLGCPG